MVVSVTAVNIRGTAVEHAHSVRFVGIMELS
jgi:hypothetical protein